MFTPKAELYGYQSVMPGIKETAVVSPMRRKRTRLRLSRNSLAEQEERGAEFI
jgi:hypothetical protein